MKNLLLILVLICSLTDASNAQSDPAKSRRIYCFASLGGGFPVAGRAAIEVLTRKGWSCSVFGFLYNKRSRNTPPNYRAFSLFDGPDPFVYETLKLAGFTVGKAWWMAGTRTRFHLKGGLAFGSFKYPINFRAPQGFVLFGANYDYDWEEHHPLDFVLQPTFEFALTQSFGFSLGSFAHLNPYRSIMGIEAAVVFGHLRDQGLRRK